MARPIDPFTEHVIDQGNRYLKTDSANLAECESNDLPAPTFQKRDGKLIISSYPTSVPIKPFNSETRCRRGQNLRSMLHWGRKK